MATSRVPVKAASKAVRATQKPKAIEPFKVATEVDADGNYDALIFGERFTLSSDVNGWLLFLAGAGRSRDVINLVESVIVVEPKDGEDIEVARNRERNRFHTTVSSQPHFSIEQAIELVNAMTEVAAGNAS